MPGIVAMPPVHQSRRPGARVNDIALPKHQTVVLQYKMVSILSACQSINSAAPRDVLAKPGNEMTANCLH